jgi:CBS domain-containing protein
MTTADARPPQDADGPPFEDARVGDHMKQLLVTCPPETPLSEVAARMGTFRIHSVIVRKVGERGGIDDRWALISDLDLAAAAAADRFGTVAGAVAASPVVTVAPAESLVRAAQLMAEHGCAHLIVVDPERGEPVGVLSTLDIARSLAVEGG